MRLIKLFIAAGVASLLATSAVDAQAYHAAVIHQPGADAIEDGYLVVDSGKIIGVFTADQLPPLMPVIELGDAHLMPGLVAADSTISGASNNTDLSLAAHHMAFDNYDPWLDYSKVLEHGVTTVYLSPDRSRLIGGRGAVVKTAGEKRVVNSRSDLLVNLTDSALNPPDYFRPPIPPTAENPLLPAERQAPTTRPGAMRALRSAIAGEPDSSGLANQRGLQEWKASAQPLRIMADNADQARAALQIANEWNSLVVLQGMASASLENYQALEASAKITLLEVPMYSSLSGGASRLDEGLIEAVAANSLVALKAGRNASWVLLFEAASIASGMGLSDGAALQAITSIPARVLGVEDRVGQLRAGFDADFLVLDGAPLDPASSVRQVYIDGERVWNRESLEALDTDAVVVRAGTLWTGDGAALSGGVEVLMQGGRIIAAGHQVPHPMGARIIEAGDDAHITPGFIDAKGYVGMTNGTRLPSNISIARLADSSFYAQAWQHVARQGVTSVVVGSSRYEKYGTRAEVIKTAAQGDNQSGLDGDAVVFFDASTRDHAQASKLDSLLKRGKKYADSFTAHAEEYATWQIEDASKTKTARQESERELRIRLALGPDVEEDDAEEDAAEEETDSEEGDDAEEETEEEAVTVDPLNGMWEGTIEHEMIPEPVTINVFFHHEGKDVTASLSSPDDPSGETLEVEGGIYENDTIHFEMPTEVGQVMIDGIIDAPDSMSVSVGLAGIGGVDFTMERIEIEQAGDFKPKKKKSKTDAGPAAPDKNNDLEGMRALFEQRGVAVVKVSRIDEAAEAIAVFAKYEIPMNLMGLAYSAELGDLLRSNNVGLLLSADTVSRVGGADLVPVTMINADGIATAFYSNSQNGSATIAQALSLATSYGLGPEQALASLTSQAADVLGVSDKIGRVKAGLDADIVIFSGAPFDLRSQVQTVFVNGNEVPRN
ncbi:MAG: amidohydrolase family protein [Planctomycetes bacterium]|nr:amidohydrolase family protein [Planctomycetota bacterium]